MKEKEFQASRLFKTLGNPLRLRIVLKLGRGAATPKELAANFQKKITNISQHMKILRDADVVWFRKEGKDVVYDLKDPGILKMIAEAESFAGRRNRGPVRKKKPPKKK